MAPAVKCSSLKSFLPKSVLQYYPAACQFLRGPRRNILYCWPSTCPACESCFCAFADAVPALGVFHQVGAPLGDARRATHSALRGRSPEQDQLPQQRTVFTWDFCHSRHWSPPIVLHASTALRHELLQIT